MAMRGNGSLYLRGTTWWMKFYRDGRPVSMSCKTESRDQAATKLRKELRKSDDEFTEPRYKRVTVGDLVGNLLEDLYSEGFNLLFRGLAALCCQFIKIRKEILERPIGYIKVVELLARLLG